MILGERFRGAITITNQRKGKLVAEKIMLIDLVRARTVFNLENAKGKRSTALA